MSNLINRIRELSKELAVARNEHGDDHDIVYDLEDEIADLEEELEEQTNSQYTNSRVDY